MYFEKVTRRMSELKYHDRSKQPLDIPVPSGSHSALALMSFVFMVYGARFIICGRGGRGKLTRSAAKSASFAALLEVLMQALNQVNRSHFLAI
jgi:hypothetical protein